MALSDGSDLELRKRQRLYDLQAELRPEYPHELPPGTLLFRCPVCSGVYPLNHFARKDDSRYGVRVPCNRCRRERRPREDNPPQDLTEKFCRSCRVLHPIREFWRDRSQPDGYARVCRDHANRRRREAEAARHFPAVEARRREQTIRLCGELGIDVPDRDLKRCLHCHDVKPLDEFGNDWTRSDRKRSECLDCRAAENRPD